MLEVSKEYFADERDDNLKEIGKGTQRQDMLGHVTGASTYFNDHKLQGMLHLKVLRSEQPHARLRRIDLTEAERSPGVRRVIRGQDVPFTPFALGFALVHADATTELFMDPAKLSPDWQPASSEPASSGVIAVHEPLTQVEPVPSCIAQY